MKVILVVDLPLEDDDVRVDYLAYNHCGDLIKKGMDCKLKPVPKKRGKVILTERSQDTDLIMWQLKTNSYSEGWNDCLDEITGETE